LLYRGGLRAERNLLVAQRSWLARRRPGCSRTGRFECLPMSSPGSRRVLALCARAVVAMCCLWPANSSSQLANWDVRCVPASVKPILAKWRRFSCRMHRVHFRTHLFLHSASGQTGVSRFGATAVDGFSSVPRRRDQAEGQARTQQQEGGGFGSRNDNVAEHVLARGIGTESESIAE
jgi:hypothetical protein